MGKKIELMCSLCNNTFLRLASEAKRNENRGRRVVCSRKCQGQLVYPNLPQTFGKKRDEYSQFRPTMKCIISACKSNPDKIGDIDLEYLKDLWESQDGICPYTKWKLIIKTDTSSKIKLTPNRASLDRIDSNKGYIRGNVVFVSYIYNISKNNFTDEEVIAFCKAVIDNT